MGSPFYMAPEQWSDEEPDSRADIYSLGIILYQMLSGDVPFKGSSIPSIMKKHLTLPVPSFKSVGVEVSPRVETVVLTALEKEVGDRTPSVEVFLAELREAMAASGSTMERVGRPFPSMPIRRCCRPKLCRVFRERVDATASLAKKRQTRSAGDRSVPSAPQSKPQRTGEDCIIAGRLRG